jgi:hypothetical protein
MHPCTYLKSLLFSLGIQHVINLSEEWCMVDVVSELPIACLVLGYCCVLFSNLSVHNGRLTYSQLKHYYLSYLQHGNQRVSWMQKLPPYNFTLILYFAELSHSTRKMTYSFQKVAFLCAYINMPFFRYFSFEVYYVAGLFFPPNLSPWLIKSPICM